MTTLLLGYGEAPPKASHVTETPSARELIVLEQAIDAPLERIWNACADARGLCAWQADKAEGRVAQGSEILLSWPALGVAIELAVEVVEPQRRLVFRSEDDARLELRFGPGRVWLEHSGEFDEDERDGTLSSWRLSLASLAHYLEHHDGKARRVHWATHHATTSLDDAHAFFTLAGAHSGWLTRGSAGTGIGETGSEVALDLAWGEPLTGRVLCHTPPRDVLVSWREKDQALLALRTLPALGGTDERLLVASYSSWDERGAEQVKGQLQAAISRLSRILEARVSA